MESIQFLMRSSLFACWSWSSNRSPVARNLLGLPARTVQPPMISHIRSFDRVQRHLQYFLLECLQSEQHTAFLNVCRDCRHTYCALTMMMICGHSGQVQRHNAIPSTVQTLAIHSNRIQSTSKLCSRSGCIWTHSGLVTNIDKASVILVTLPTILAVMQGVLQSLTCFPVP